MVVSQNVEQITVCPLCRTQLPFMNSDGKHNFCPAVMGDGQVVDLCMECKVGRLRIRPQPHLNIEAIDVHKNEWPILICPLCRTRLPFINSEGKHNFCPAVTGNGQIVDLCMGCKMTIIKMRRGPISAL